METANDGPGASLPAWIAQTETFVRARLAGDATGHDWWHTDRVRRLALWLAAREGADRAVVELAALLHDVADWKFHGGDETVGGRTARTWLEGLGADAGLIGRVVEVMAEVTFKGAGVETPVRSREAAVVQDADRLDALGAIGIARTFAYGGAKGQAMHDPDLPPADHRTFREYQAARGTSINHFHEKLLRLPARLQTASARSLAEERRDFMVRFLAEFSREWSWVPTESEQIDP